jgi:hypothetical protein
MVIPENPKFHWYIKIALIIQIIFGPLDFLEKEFCSGNPAFDIMRYADNRGACLSEG